MNQLADSEERTVVRIEVDSELYNEISTLNSTPKVSGMVALHVPIVPLAIAIFYSKSVRPCHSTYDLHGDRLAPMFL